MSAYRVDPIRLAAELAARLSAVVPGRVSISVSEEGQLLFRLYDSWYAGGSDPRTALVDLGGDPAEAVCVAAANALDALQDYVCEASGEPWPVVKGGSEKRTIANPHAVVAGSRIHMWFGDHDAPTLALEDLPVESVIETT
jgi:hypothetical protein